MATRPNKSDNGMSLPEVFRTLASFDVTESDPVSTEDFATELGITPAEAFAFLDALADAELVDAKGRGLSAEWWISVPDVSEDNAESVARKALNGSVTVAETPAKPKRQSKAEKDAEARARLEYATRAAESQDEIMSQSPEFMDADKRRKEGVKRIMARVKPEYKAETPVKGSDGENITIPVDFDDPSKGRRELDASKGERLIGEDTFTVRVAEPKSQDKGLNSYVDSETGETLYESAIEKNGLALDEPSEIPSCPNGVSRNTWYMAHAAVTQTARDWWLSRAKQQEEIYKINNGAPAPF